MLIVRTMRAGLLACIGALVMVVPTVASAQTPGVAAPQYKAEDKIEYKTGYPPKWQEGTFVKIAGNGNQAVIRETPNQWYPDGFQRAYDLDQIRPLAAPMPLPAPVAIPGMPDDPAALPMPVGLPPLTGLPEMPNLPPVAAGPLKEGDQIEYLKARWPVEQWLIGTFVRMSPDGTQAVIREAPSQFYPQGFQRAIAIEDIRPLPKPPGDVSDFAGCGDEPGSGTQAAPATTPMSQDEVLSFLRARLGAGDPFRNPKRDEYLQQLREEILRRGVAFRYEVLGKFSNELSNFGALSNVTAALASNFGPLRRIDDILGPWVLMKTGVRLIIEDSKYKYMRDEWVGLAGDIFIQADHTYAWMAPSGLIEGTWRPATSVELAKSDKGGEGIVLLKGKSKADWLVFHRDEEGPEGRGIKIVDLETRNLRERGTRQKRP